MILLCPKAISGSLSGNACFSLQRMGKMLTEDKKKLSWPEAKAKNTWARPIKPRDFSPDDYWIEPVAYLKNSSTTRKVDRRMSYYFVWMYFLRLAMDCEEAGITIIGKTHRGQSGDKRYERHPIKIDDSKYSGWGFREAWVKKAYRFDSWWESKRHLFVDIGKTTEIKSEEDLDL